MFEPLYHSSSPAQGAPAAGGGTDESGRLDGPGRDTRRQEPLHDPRRRAVARDRADVLGGADPRRNLSPGHRSGLERDPRGAHRNARRARDRIRRRALRAPVRGRRRGLRVPDPRRAPVGRRARGRASSSSARCSSAAAGSTSGSGSCSDGFWTAHISDSGPAWWVWGAIALAIVLVLNYFGVRIAVRAMLTFAALSFVPMLILAIVIIAKGGEDGITLSMFNPSETSWLGITGGGVLGGVLLGILLFVGFEAAASLGEESHDPHRSIPRAVLFTIAAAGAFYVVMAFAFSIGYGKDGGLGGRLGVLSGPRQRDGDAVRRRVVRDAPRARRDPRCDGARARDLCARRPRVLRARPRRPRCRACSRGCRATTRRGSATSSSPSAGSA